MEGRRPPREECALRFKDRTHAGRALAGMLRGPAVRECTVLAVPNGGIPVGIEIANSLRAPLGVEIVRKLQIPQNSEAGFGAMTSSGGLILNQILVKALRLGPEQVRKIKAATMHEIERRKALFGAPDRAIGGRTVILTDDGLASGFTMVAAARSVRRQGPKKVIVAVPTAPESSIARVEKVADQVVCPDIRRALSFAVADAYDHWYDLTTDEAAELFREWQATKNP
jgi:predicted phosphoribosyltransferase